MMNRKKNRHDLPRYLLRYSGKSKNGKIWVAYYYYGPLKGEEKRRKIPLGSDLGIALHKWAELKGEIKPKEALNPNTFDAIAKNYIKEVLPSKAPQTQKDYKKYYKKLSPVFGHMDINHITTPMLQKYIDLRSAKTTSNRELAFVSVVFNYGIRRGHTDKPNPCKAVEKNREKPRDRYITDAEYQAVYKVACQPLRDAMDLAYLTAQRPADVLKMKLSDIKPIVNSVGEELEVLCVVQNKTGARLQINITGELYDTLERIVTNRLEKGTTCDNLLINEKGEPLTYFSLRKRFDKARIKAKLNFQFRDLRAKAATDIYELNDASNLLGHTSQRITNKVYRRLVGGQLVNPTK